LFAEAFTYSNVLNPRKKTLFEGIVYVNPKCCMNRCIFLNGKCERCWTPFNASIEMITNAINAARGV